MLIQIFERILSSVSPTFNFLKGDESRLDALLHRTERLREIILSRRDFLGTDQLQSECDLNLLGEKIDESNNCTLKVIRYECSLGDFFEKMKKFFLRTSVVLDIGCGIHPQTFFIPRVHICIEPFGQYRKIIKPYFPNPCEFIFLKEDALSSIRALDDNSVDTVFMVDLIEHLEKKDGLILLKEADRVARKQIIVFTPLGFYPMHFKEEGQKDAWGLNGNDLQEHKSGWLPEDFGGGWDFHICEDCHEAFLPEEKAAGKKYSALMAIKTKRFSGFDVMEETPKFVKAIYSERVSQSEIK